jgi:hypothetical protein
VVGEGEQKAKNFNLSKNKEEQSNLLIRTITTRKFRGELDMQI